MKILKIDHIGIAVTHLNESKKFWTDVLGLEFSGSETVEEQNVTTAFFPVGESEVELLESTASDGPVARYLKKRRGDTSYRLSCGKYPGSFGRVKGKRDKAY